MKIKQITIKNFRGYQGETTIKLDDFTALIGMNDVGKSTVLEALYIFFNDGKGSIKMDKTDVNINARANNDSEIVISVSFTDLPPRVVLDATNETTLEAEHLLNDQGDLEIVKRYSNGGTAKVYIKAVHPRNPKCCDLLSKKDTDLKKQLEKEHIPCEDKARNAVMRKAIWDHYKDDLQLELVEVDISKLDGKAIWERIQMYLPLYTLFQADRKNNDSDDEVQDPLREAVKQIIHTEELQNKLNEVAIEVEKKLKEVSDRTLEKLREMSPEVADTLSPVIPPSDSLKWADVFKNVSIAGDENIPVNKRGSGTKRLILLNFFRAEVERRQEAENAPSVIYAIEEPETSQHSENQKKLIKALLELSGAPNTQILITTHSPIIVKNLSYDNIRIITSESNIRSIQEPAPSVLPYPSLNEVNYIAFTEIAEEYHDELYGFIYEHGLLQEYNNGKSQIPYIRKLADGTPKNEQRTLTGYIRDVMHHPENTFNKKYDNTQLKDSIVAMREFISRKRANVDLNE